jgi:hypothetical protein
MKQLRKMLRMKLVLAAAAFVTVSSAAYATLTVTCVYCVSNGVGVATATPAGYYQYEWVVAYPGYASPAVTNTNSTLVAFCPVIAGAVVVKAYDSSHNLIDSGIAFCGGF